MSTNIEGKIVVVTGASSGIGESTARHLAKRGATVVLGKRRKDRLEKLVIATGVRVRTLDVSGSDLPGLFYLRCDSKRIRAHAESARRAVVIGGFIAMEVTSVLAQKRLAATMVPREDRMWEKFFTPQMSNFFEDYYAKRGSGS